MLFCASKYGVKGLFCSAEEMRKRNIAECRIPPSFFLKTPAAGRAMAVVYRCVVGSSFYASTPKQSQAKPSPPAIFRPDGGRCEMDWMAMEGRTDFGPSGTQKTHFCDKTSNRIIGSVERNG